MSLMRFAKSAARAYARAQQSRPPRHHKPGGYRPGASAGLGASGGLRRIAHGLSRLLRRV